MIKYHSHKAFVQFETTESAKAALHSPDAVLGNRFVQLAWVRPKHEPVVHHRIPPLTSHSLILNRPATTTAPTPVIQENYGERIKELTTIVHKKNELLQQQLNMYRMVFAKIDNMGEMTKEKMELMDFLKQLDTNIKKLQQEQYEATQKLATIQAAQQQQQQQQQQQVPQSITTATTTTGHNEAAKVESSPAATSSEGGQQESSSADTESTTEEATKESSDKVNVPTVSFSGRGRGRGGTILRGGPMVRDRGAWRSRGGAIHAVPLVKRSLTLDNRTTTLQVRGVPDDKRSEEQVKRHFEQFGPVESIEYESANDAYNVKFTTRVNAQKALEQGKEFTGAPLKFQWKMEPKSATTATPSISSVQNETSSPSMNDVTNGKDHDEGQQQQQAEE